MEMEDYLCSLKSLSCILKSLLFKSGIVTVYNVNRKVDLCRKVYTTLYDLRISVYNCRP